MMLTQDYFDTLAPRTVLFLEHEHGMPVTKADVLALCAASPGSAHRLYLACRCAFTPITVLCRDLFEMPERRQFPELAADFADAPSTATLP